MNGDKVYEQEGKSEQSRLPDSVIPWELKHLDEAAKSLRVSEEDTEVTTRKDAASYRADHAERERRLGEDLGDLELEKRAIIFTNGEAPRIDVNGNSINLNEFEKADLSGVTAVIETYGITPSEWRKKGGVFLIIEIEGQHYYIDPGTVEFTVNSF